MLPLGSLLGIRYQCPQLELHRKNLSQITKQNKRRSVGSGRRAGHESQALISGISTQAKGAKCSLACFFST